MASTAALDRIDEKLGLAFGILYDPDLMRVIADSFAKESDEELEGAISECIRAHAYPPSVALIVDKLESTRRELVRKRQSEYNKQYTAALSALSKAEHRVRINWGELIEQSKKDRKEVVSNISSQIGLDKRGPHSESHTHAENQIIGAWNKAGKDQGLQRAAECEKFIVDHLVKKGIVTRKPTGEYTIITQEEYA